MEGSLACGSWQSYRWSYKWREALLVAHCRVTSGGKPCLWLIVELQVEGSLACGSWQNCEASGGKLACGSWQSYKCMEGSLLDDYILYRLRKGEGRWVGENSVCN